MKATAQLVRGSVETAVEVAEVSRHSEAEPPAQDIRAQLDKILAGDAFIRSVRLSGFLRFVVQNALRGQSDQLKEYTIALEVYQRPPSFDSTLDPIVRVETRRLRATLEKYYGGEGLHDLIRIEIPKGRYVPVFTAMRPSARQKRTPGRLCSIAVLPFANLSADPEQEYFCDGLTDELINALGHLEGLRVAARCSVYSFRAAHQDVRRIGKQLNVHIVLEGSVRKLGDRLRITAMLISVADGYHLWSERYDCETKDVFAVQDEISWAIVKPLATRLAGERRFEPAATVHADNLVPAA